MLFIFQNILHNMTSFDSQQSGEDSIQEESQNDFAKLFVDFDGLEVWHCYRIVGIYVVHCIPIC